MQKLDIIRAWIRFREFGGLRLLREYARLGLLGRLVGIVVRCMLKRQSMKYAYSLFLERVETVLIERYGGILDEALDDSRKGENTDTADVQVPNIIWTCWLQGIEQAPELVKACLASQKRCLNTGEHRALSVEIYHKWVEIPDFIEQKYKKGIIPAALFSDILRLAVLKKYGGIWMDASVLCTGFDNEVLKKQWDSIMGSELTIPRYYARGAKVATGLSNWFIAARPNNVIISVVYDMLVAYWRDFDCAIDYYMMHLFLEMALKASMGVENKMPKLNSRYCFLLGNSLKMDFDKGAWDDLIAHVGIHKLNYRKAEEVSRNNNGYYSHVLGL